MTSSEVAIISRIQARVDVIGERHSDPEPASTSAAIISFTRLSAGNGSSAACLGQDGAGASVDDDDGLMDPDGLGGGHRGRHGRRRIGRR